MSESYLSADEFLDTLINVIEGDRDDADKVLLAVRLLADYCTGAIVSNSGNVPTCACCKLYDEYCFRKYVYTIENLPLIYLEAVEAKALFENEKEMKL